MSTAQYPPRPQGYQYPPTGLKYPPSSRSVYPTFLSLQDSVVLQLKWAWGGIFDAFRWNVVVSAVARCVELSVLLRITLLIAAVVYFGSPFVCDCNHKL